MLFYPREEVDELLASFAPAPRLPPADASPASSSSFGEDCADIGSVCGKLTAYSVCTYFVTTVRLQGPGLGFRV